MLKLNVIGSGSSGNCYILETNNRYIVVDIGVPLYKVRDEITFEEGKTIDLFITHEHVDHILGLKPFINAFNPKVYTSEGTAFQIHKKKIEPEHFFVLDTKKIYAFDDYEVIPFNTSHDACQPFGYRFNFTNSSISFATDMGIVTNEVLEIIRGSFCLILESNYEDDMLLNGSYPTRLKKRVMSTKGHLSNKEAINLVSQIFSFNLKKLFFGHISEENNDYSLMERYASFCRKNFHIEADYFMQHTIKKGILIGS